LRTRIRVAERNICSGPELPKSQKGIFRMETLIKTDSEHTVELDNIQPPPHYDDVEGPQIITSDTARQGPLGSRVLVVLVWGLAAVCIAFGLVYFFSYQ
jgi:hypothetical protein